MKLLEALKVQAQINIQICANQLTLQEVKLLPVKQQWSGQSSSAFLKSVPLLSYFYLCLSAVVVAGEEQGQASIPPFLASPPFACCSAQSPPAASKKKVRDLQAMHTKSRPVQRVGSSHVVQGHGVALWCSKGVEPPCCCPAPSSPTCCPAPYILPEHQPHLQLCSQVRTSLQMPLRTTDTSKCCFQTLLHVFLGALTWTPAIVLLLSIAACLCRGEMR